MGRGQFTKNEIDSLRKNPYVSDVNQTCIAYSSEFKILFMTQYTEGKKPIQIFRDAGFDPKVLGSKRIERASARWRESYRSGTLGERNAILSKEAPATDENGEICEPDLLQSSKKALVNRCKDQEKTIRQLQAELLVMQKILSRGVYDASEAPASAEICSIIEEVTSQEEYRSCISHLCDVTGISRSKYYRNKRKNKPHEARRAE